MPSVKSQITNTQLILEMSSMPDIDTGIKIQFWAHFQWKMILKETRKFNISSGKQQIK